MSRPATFLARQFMTSYYQSYGREKWPMLYYRYADKRKKAIGPLVASFLFTVEIRPKVNTTHVNHTKIKENKKSRLGLGLYFI